MAFNIYYSTDPGAPTLNGLTGSLLPILDGCLVTGIGSKPSAGWSRVYSGSGTNPYAQAVYQAPSGSRAAYLYIGDNAQYNGTAAGRESYWWMAESLLPITTNPTAVISAQGWGVRKSATADSTARPWICFADDRTVYFLAQSGDTAGRYSITYFGDFYSLMPNDKYNLASTGRNLGNSSAGANECFDAYQANGFSLGYLGVIRSYLGLGSTVACSKAPANSAMIVTTTSNDFAWTGNIVFPNPTDGGLYLSPIWIYDYTTSPAPHIRGRMRGVWMIGNKSAQISFNDKDTFQGVGDLAGKTFMIIKTGFNGFPYAFEISNTLETNT